MAITAGETLAVSVARQKSEGRSQKEVGRKKSEGVSTETKPSQPVDICPCCGHPGGRKACQDLFDDVALRVRALAWTGSLTTWRLMHDVYSIQHE